MIYFNLIVDSWFLIPLSNLFCFQLSLFSPDDMTIERALEFWFRPEDILCVEKSRLPCACLRKCLRGIFSCTAMNNACLPMNVSFLCLPIAKKFILFNNELLLTMLFESFPKGVVDLIYTQSYSEANCINEICSSLSQYQFSVGIKVSSLSQIMLTSCRSSSGLVDSRYVTF